MGIEAEDFTTEQAPISTEQYSGRCEVFVPEKVFEGFKKNGISPHDVYQVDEEAKTPGSFGSAINSSFSALTSPCVRHSWDAQWQKNHPTAL